MGFVNFKQILGRAAFYFQAIDAGAGVSFTALMVATTTGGSMAARTRPNASETGFTDFWNRDSRQ